MGFCACIGLLRVQSIESRASVGVDHLQGRVFLGQMTKDRQQHQMFEDVGVIAGVKGMAVTEHNASKV
jgi:hypothetical protein